MAGKTGTRKLTFGEMMEIKRLNYRWATAPNEERERIEARIAKIKQGAQEDSGDHEEPKKPQKSQNPQKTQQAQKSQNSQQAQQNQQKAPTPKREPDVPPKQKSEAKEPTGEKVTASNYEMRYLLYCGCTEMMIMVNTAKGWMSYDIYREKHPKKTVFDIDPDDVIVMYMDHGKYQEMLEADDDAPLDRCSVISQCARPLPNGKKPIEIAILNDLLATEAQHDSRIKDLGYETGTVEECEESGLFEDFFTGVIFNVLHMNMTIKGARHYFKTGERLEQQSAEEKTPKQERPTEETPPKQQPKQQPKPIPQGKKPSAQTKKEHARRTL